MGDNTKHKIWVSELKECDFYGHIFWWHPKNKFKKPQIMSFQC